MDGGDLDPRRRRWLTVLWCSFLTASVATMLFFAFVDPAADFGGTRTAAYSAGFLFFWLICAIASAMTAWLMTPSRSDYHEPR